ncbi:MAG: prephenate dehydrogenase [Eubacteriales bacterium]
MKVGICGLGLIGGSMAKAYKKENHTVYGFDANQVTLDYAKIKGIIDDTLTDGTLVECDVVFIALYPQAAIEYLKEIAPKVAPDTLVIDLCGTKRTVCAVGFALAEQYGFTYVGGHPMAGTQFSGIKYADENLFAGAPMVMVPPRYDDIDLFSRVKNVLAPAHFGKLSITTAEDHDAIISFTSQLAHIVSNAYVKSPTAKMHRGYSAGSYADLTRVAWLNEDMWTQLFLENGDNLAREIDGIIQNLAEYRDAIAAHDSAKLHDLLRDGRIAKEQIDGGVKD